MIRNYETEERFFWKIINLYISDYYSNRYMINNYMLYILNNIMYVGYFIVILVFLFNKNKNRKSKEKSKKTIKGEIV